MADQEQAQQESPQGPPFYKRPEVLRPEAHANLGINGSKRTFKFAKDASFVAVNGAEFEMAAKHYPVIFSSGADVVPIAVFGLGDRGNLYVNKKGAWEKDHYIPEYVRRYPFIFMQTNAETQEFALSVDLGDDEVIAEHAEQPFFLNGNPTDFTNRALEFCKTFHQQHVATQNFVKFLQENDLLTERHAEYTPPDGQTVPIANFLAVDEDKFNDLSDAAFGEIRKRGYLRPICGHLSSLINFSRTYERAAGIRN